MKDVLLPIAAALRESRPLIISIAAGIEIGSIETWLGGELPIVRCMPNTPALVQTGATGLFVGEVTGNGLAAWGHRSGPPMRTVKVFHSSSRLGPRSGTLRGKQKLLRLKGFTSSGQSRG